jgi:hypothetical protein
MGPRPSPKRRQSAVRAAAAGAKAWVPWEGTSPTVNDEHGVNARGEGGGAGVSCGRSKATMHSESCTVGGGGGGV